LGWSEKRRGQGSVTSPGFRFSSLITFRRSPNMDPRNRSTLVCFLGSALRDHLEKDLILDRFHSLLGENRLSTSTHQLQQGNWLDTGLRVCADVGLGEKNDGLDFGSSSMIKC
jgi:hypothetical protein